MNKAMLETFIRKYHLNGSPPVEDVIWEIKDNKLLTRFMTDDQTVLGEVLLRRFDFEDCELGVYVTSQLVKMMSALDTSIDISLEKIADKIVSVRMADKSTKINYMLADKNVIRKVPSLKKKPDFNVKVNLTKEKMDRFVKSKGALLDVDTFTFIKEKDGTPMLVIGYSSTINSNRISLDVDCDYEGEVSPISFNANHFREIIGANKEADRAVLQISTEGLAHIEFDFNDFLSVYYLVQIITE